MFEQRTARMQSRWAVGAAACQSEHMDLELTLAETFKKLGIALGLGLLVGMQRQRIKSPLAGIRTFPLVTMMGTIAGLLAVRFGDWIIAAALLSLAGFVIVSNLTMSKSAPAPDPGITTEVALLLMFGVGAYLVAGYTSVAVVLAGTIAVLLHLKPEMHAFVHRLGEKDVKAIMQFVLITLVILPVLPDKTFGPYAVLNPYKIWLLAVLTVGLSLGGYVLYKFLGARTGSIVGGVLGGLISSTATTLSYARRTREAPDSSALSALVIMIASTVVFIRILFIVLVVSPQQFPVLVGPIATVLGIATLVAAGAWFLTGNQGVAMPVQENPSELKPALIFAAMFALVLLGVATARQHFGTQGLYLVAILSGLTDMDAITLSTLQTSTHGQLSANLAWRMILAAAMANLVFKAAIVATVGSRKLLGQIAVMFGIAFLAGLLTLWLWPNDPGQSSPQTNLPAIRSLRDLPLIAAQIADCVRFGRGYCAS